MARLKFYQRLSLVSGLVLALLNHFAFGFLGFMIPFAKAATVTWVGPSYGSWDDPTNWSGGEVPTAFDNVIIDLESNGPVIATSTINFDSLTLQNMNKDFGGSFYLMGTIGSGRDITLETLDGEPGSFTFSSSQTITGTLTVGSGTAFYPVYLNTSTPISPIQFNAQNINIEPGGYVLLRSFYEGFLGGDSYGDGQGIGPGIFGSGPNGSGGAHAGNGGMDAQGDLGGLGYCNFENPETLGSGGGGGGPGFNNFGNGGSFLKLSASDEITINGKIMGGGLDSEDNGDDYDAGGGGGGAGIVLSADIISGTPELFDVSGGNSVGDFNSRTGGDGGGGGGGCVKISYGTSNSINPLGINAYGGYGYQRGGGGTVFVQKLDNSVRSLYVGGLLNTSSTLPVPASTVQTQDELTLESIIFSGISEGAWNDNYPVAVYEIPSGKTLTLTSSTPFDGPGLFQGKVIVSNGATLAIDPDAVLKNVMIELHEGGNMVDRLTGLSNTLNLTVGSSAIVDMRDFSTSTPLVLHKLTIESDGLITHGSHEGLGDNTTNIVNVEANAITIESGGKIDVSGKGFSGGVNGENGNGPGGGEFAFGTATGAGHGGDGTANLVDGSNAGPGGSGYCDVSNPSTLGSGGNSGFFSGNTGIAGGNGGGTVWLTVTNEFVLNGDILADGENGDYVFFVGDEVFESISGAGAGGAVKIYASKIYSSGHIFARGGDNGFDSDAAPSEYGGGGGGCVFIDYVSKNSIVTSSVDVLGGGLSTGQAEPGLFSIVKENQPPSIMFDVERPTLVKRITDDVYDQAYGFDVAGNYAYTGNFSSDFTITDISSSTDPVIVGGIEGDSEEGQNLGAIIDIDVAGNYAYTAGLMFDGTLEFLFRVIDITSSTHPVTVSGLEFNSVDADQFMWVEVSGNYAYVSTANFDENNTLYVVDISNPLNPTVVGQIDNFFPASALEVSGQYLYFAAYDADFGIVDISNPATPQVLGYIDAQEGTIGRLSLDRVNDIVSSEDGNYVYAVSIDSGIVSTIDVSNKMEPEIVGTTSLDGESMPLNISGFGMEVSGNYAYVNVEIGRDTTDMGIGVVDISNPLNPQYVGFSVVDGPTQNGFIKIKDGYAYLTFFSGEFFVYDISRTAQTDPNIGMYVLDYDRQDVSVKAEYVTGRCSIYSAGSYATFSPVVSSTFGAVINNTSGDNRRVRDIVTNSDDEHPISFVSSTWRASEDLPGIEGEYCMYLTAYDGEQEGDRVSASIMVDNPLQAPLTPALAVSAKSQTSITLSWNIVGGVDYYTVSSSISEINTETTETSVTYAGLNPGTEYIFQIRATDSFGNHSAYSSLLVVSTNNSSSGGGGGGLPTPPEPPYIPGTPSTTPSSTPSNPSGLILINGGAMYTNSRNVVLSFNTNFTDAYALSDSSDFLGKSFLPIVPNVPYTLTPGDGEKKVYARFSNSYGIYEAYDVILLDSVAPIKPILSSVASADLVMKREGVYVRKVASSTNRIIPLISGIAEPGTRIVITITSGVEVAVAQTRLANVQTFYALTDQSGQWSFTFPFNLENTSYQLAVQSEDAAGNLSGASYSYFDFSSTTTPPEVPPCMVNCQPVQEPPIDPPCTVNCEPIEIPPGCTVNCGSEPENPPSTGEGESDSTTTGSSEGEGTTESSSSEESETSNETQNTTSVVENITDSVAVVGEVVKTFFSEVGESIQQIPGVKAVIRVTEVAIGKVEEVIDNPVVEKTNEVVAAPVIAAAAVVNVAAGGATVLSQLMIYLRLIFSQPLLLIRRRRQKNWGTVFNGYTKQPIDLALVRLVEGKTNKVIRTQVTDIKGRYFILSGAGVYRLEAKKEGFDTQKVHVDDTMYPNVYHGETLSLTEDHNEFNYHIPLHPEQQEKTAAQLLKEYGRAAARRTTSMLGAIATIGSFIISPKPWITALLVVHIVLYGIMKRLAHKKVKGVHGVVTDTTKNCVSKVVIRVFDANYNKLVATAITDSKGRYAVLVGPSTYYITAEKQGYELYKSGVIDLSSDKTKGVGGVIAESVMLSKSNTVSQAPKEEKYTVRTMPMV